MSITTQNPPSLLVKASTQLSQFLGIEPAMMIETIKAQCFKNTTPDKVSDAQLAAFISIAAALKLNPLLPGMMYAYPERSGGVQAMIGPDGVFMLLANNPDIVANEKSGSAWWIEHSGEGDNETCTAFINHRSKGIVKKTIFIKEWTVGSNPNWAARRRHMAEIRALKQCARQIIHGLPMDEDERKIAEMHNVTGSVPLEASAAPAAPSETLSERLESKRGRGRPKKENVVEGQVETAATPPSVEQPPHKEEPREALAPTPEPPAPPAESHEDKQRVIDATQDKMLELGVSESKLWTYASKISGMIPEGCKSVWDLPVASIEKLAKAIPALSVGRTPAA